MQPNKRKAKTMDRFSKISDSSASVFYRDTAIDHAFDCGARRVMEPGWYYDSWCGPYATQEEALVAEHKIQVRALEEAHENTRAKVALAIMFMIVVLTGGGFSLIGIGI